MEGGITQAVSVDDKGLVVTWDPDTNICISHKITLSPGQSKYKTNAIVLKMVEPIPHQQGKVLVAADQDIYHFDLKSM